MTIDKKGFFFLFTGRPASGKSTLITKLEPMINSWTRVQLLEPEDILLWVREKKYPICRINVPITISTIKPAMRLSEHGINVLCSHSVPTQHMRLKIKEILQDKYVEIFVKCSEETCINRISNRPRVKIDNLFRQKVFEHLNRYEEPLSPDLMIDTETNSLNECLEIFQKFIKTFLTSK